MSDIVLILITVGLCLLHTFLLIRETKRSKGYGPKILCLASALLVLVIWAALLVPNFKSVHVSCPNYACVGILKQLVGAKATWALELNKTGTDAPLDSDLFGSDKYIREKPTCPSGGVYHLGTVSQNPTCSLGGPAHSLP